MNIKLKVVTLATSVALSGVVAVVPFAAVADHATAHTIEQLSAQIAALQAQLVALGSGSSSASVPAAGKCSFTRSLTVGARGDDVTCLQNYLKGTGHFTYAGGATGYFGGVTRTAVAAWQSANGVAPAAGYFGTLSRGKYDSMVAAAPAAPAAPGAAPAVVVAVGSGLTVTSPADQPAATLAPESAARVPFVRAVFTASADGDVTVKSVTVERTGLADDASFDGILLIDEDGAQIGNSKTLTSDHKVALDGGFVVKAGTSKLITIAANMVADNSGRAGQIANLSIAAVNAGTSVVNASLPIKGNGMTINSTLDIGTVTMSIGSLDPGAANSKNVGTKGYYLASVKASIGSAEDVTFESLRFNQAGSAATGDLENVLVVAGSKDYPATVSADGKYYVAKFPAGLKVLKGANLEFSIKADLVNGSARTVDMDILRKSDIVVKGNTFGYYALSTGGTSGAATVGNFSTNQEPFFNAYAATINKGSVQVSSSNKVSAANIPIDVSDTILGGFLIDVKGEPAQISSFRLTYAFSGTGTGTDVVGVKLTDVAGAILAGPKDGVAAGITFTDTWTLPAGENHVYVKGKLDTTFLNNATVQVAIDPDDSITVKGTVTGLAITSSPTSAVTSNTQTVKAGAVSMSTGLTPFGQNVVRGINGYLFSTFTFDAGSSGEDARVTAVKIRQTANADASRNDVNTCKLYDGATALNTGSDAVDPSDDGTDVTNDLTFTLTNNLIIPKGTIKNVDLKCNISSSADADSTHRFGLNDLTGTAVVGASTGQAITESVTTGLGSLMTFKAAGSFTVSKDSSSPQAGYALANKTDVPMTVLRYTAVDEAIDITEITLTFASGTASTSDFLKATVWDGATKIGAASWAGTATNATSTFTAPFVVPKDGDRLLTIKADIGSVSSIASTTAGRLLAINYNGISSSTGTGVSSGQKLGSSTGGDINGSSMQIMKTLPTLAKIAVPSTVLPQTDAIMYRFKVTADAAGPVALYKLTFKVSSSSISATTSNFRVFAYTDSSFSVKAYDNNPTHLSNVDCVSLSNMDSDTDTCATAAIAITGSTASTTDVVWFFGPVDNTASTTEAVTVPAGLTYYFELRGDITNPGSGTGNSIQVSLLGDDARPVRITGSNAAPTGNSAFHDSARGFLGTAAGVAAQSANNDFVWSPMSTSTVLTRATSTTDWTNGFLVPGLPSTNMDANTFSN
jgi:peptidoglycan hydrolase-like protein with peptidoglycan-binding domain